MNHIKNNILGSIVISIFILQMSALPVFADDAMARKIMEKVDARDDGDNQIADMEMILIDKKGRQRVRKIRTFTKDKGEDTYRLMFFIHPADVKDTAFLTYDYDDPDRDDDQWLYLPALHKTKRIASSDKSRSFMGSDLTYSDMTSRELEDYDFFFKKEMEVKGEKTWLIESIPRSKKVIKETGYTKSLLWVRQDNFFVIRAINWVKDGGYLKYTDVRRLEVIDGIWVGTHMVITTKKGNHMVHRTILNWRNVRFNQNLDYDLFTVRRMEKGL
ncbi:MAG: outer membrane lipoprotein-sorting protein [Deltaproteobacteria bacterium]|nr:outer membrane lipoprotein-sorting protein [Deltaproteobacteria bacterium]